MIDIKELRKDKRPQSAWVVHALLDRLEAAEKELTELRSSMQFRTSLIGRTEAERDALRAKIKQMEQPEQARLVTPTAYRWRHRGSVMWQYGELTEETVQAAKEHNHEVQSLYALPGAKEGQNEQSN